MGTRKRVLAGLLMLSASIAAVVSAGAGSAATQNNLSVDLKADPGPAAVTYGGNVAFTLVIDSLGNNPWHNVLVTVPAPSTGDTAASKAILKHEVCPGTDLSGPTSSDIVCDLGTVDADETPTLFFVYAMPSTGTDCVPTASACVKVEASVTGQEGTVAPDSPRSSKGKEDNFGDLVEITLLDTLNSDKQRAATYALGACGNPATPTLATNGQLSRSNPLQTQVCIPSVPVEDPFNVGHPVVVSERAHTSSDPGKTQVSDICIPALGTSCIPGHTPFVFAEPMTLTFVLDNKSFSGKITKVFEDGALVSADPGDDPHVLSITVNPSAGTTTVVVKSSDNGGWDFG